MIILPKSDQLLISGIKGLKKAGIMGGTFDPIHYGHLAAAEAVREALGLDIVIFMPAGISSFKRDKAVTDGEHRYAMTLGATAKNPYFYVSRAELDRRGISYTVDTARAFRAFLPPKTRMYFILGADAFTDILKWHGVDELMGLADFAVISRPGAAKGRLMETVETIRKFHKAKIRLLDIPGLDISSTAIRKQAAKGGSIRYLTPYEVAEYIREQGLYQQALPIGEIQEKLKKSLSPKRFAHSLSVAKEAKRLAVIHGADPDKAYLAGLIHDAAKEFTDAKLLKKARQLNISIDPITLANPSLLHSIIGAEIVKGEYGVKDEDILNAIRSHNTGRPAMSLLEKIIYVADYIEPRRPYHLEGIETARKCAEFDLDAAVVEVLVKKLAWVSGPAHPLSQQALDYMLFRGRDDS